MGDMFYDPVSLSTPAPPVQPVVQTLDHDDDDDDDDDGDEDDDEDIAEDAPMPAQPLLPACRPRAVSKSATQAGSYSGWF